VGADPRLRPHPGAGRGFRKTVYLRTHRIRSGQQTIAVKVPKKPSDPGVNPYVVLLDLERFDNLEEVEIER
jgi:ABC-2 type transport system permease protein